MCDLINGVIWEKNHKQEQGNFRVKNIRRATYLIRLLNYYFFQHDFF